MRKSIERIYLFIIFLFLYLPIMVLIVLSFNNSKAKVVWGGFTLRWYRELFTNRAILEAFSTTIFVSLASALLATLLGTLAALGIDAMKKSPAECRYCHGNLHDAFICTLYTPGA